MFNEEKVSMDTLYMKSRIVDHSRKFEWIVSSFSKYPAMSSIISKEFKLAAVCPFKWIIEIVVSTQTFRMFIRRIDHVDNIFPISGTLSFQNSEGEIHEKVLNSIYVFENVSDQPKNTEIWSSNRPGHSTAEMANFPFQLPNDEVTIKCHIIVSNCCIVTEEIEDSRWQDVPEDISLSRDLFQDLRTMYFDKPLTDILLKVGGDFLPCHKFILCSRSSVFRKILEEDTNVKKFGIIAIEDMDSNVMDEFMEYLYTNSFSGRNPEVLLELYGVSVKYRMAGLQEKCSAQLAKCLNEKTVCKTLTLADKNNDVALKEASSVFITQNFYKLKDTEEFGAFVESNPRLFFQVISNSLGKVLSNS